MTARRGRLGVALVVGLAVGTACDPGPRGDGAGEPRSADEGLGPAVAVREGARGPRVPLAGRRVALDGALVTAETDDGIDVRVSTDVLFAVDRARLGGRARAVLREAASDLGRPPAVVVVGHTDTRGTEAYNDRLSERRARAVRRALAPLLPGTRITAEGRGETQPVGSDDTPAGRRANRRVEIRGPAAGP